MPTPLPARIKGAYRAALSVLFDATNPREIFRRPFEPRSVGRITEEVNASDRLTLLSDANKIYANLGTVKGAVDQKAMLSVGRAWLPRFEGKDSEWGKAARDWLLEKWYPMASITGEDFQTALYLASTGIDREGDVGLSPTEYETGFPAIQLIPGQSIGQRNADTVVAGGTYKGLRQYDGVAINDIGQAVGYLVLGSDSKGKDDEWISARDMFLLREPQYVGQYRGLPAYSHAILDLKNIRQVQGYEQMAAALCSSIGILEYNEHGMPDMSNPSVGLNAVTVSNGGMVSEARDGGTIRYIKAGDGSKIEAFKNDRPGDGFDRLMNRFLRNATSGMCWPFEMAYDMSSLGGVNSRIIIAMAQRAIADRQDLLRPHAKRAVGYAISKAIKNGDLAPSDEWWRWGFTMPARLTSDYGRDKAQDREDYLNGLTNLSDICEERGENVDDFIARRQSDNAKLLAADLPLPMTPAQAAAEAAQAQAEAQQQQQPSPEAAKASADMSARLAALESAPAPVIPPQVIPPAPVTVNFTEGAFAFTAPAPVVNVTPAPVHVAAPVVTISEGAIQLSVAPQPAPVVNITIPKAGDRKVTRDEQGKITGLSEG